MKAEKNIFEFPLTMVMNVRAEGVVCGSNTPMKFGSDNSSGSIDDDDVIDIEALAQVVADLTAKGPDIRVVNIVTQEEAIR